MDRDDVLIRPATPADVPEVAAIVREENPLRVFSDRGWQHRGETTPERARRLELVAVVNGDIVGQGGASLDASTSVQGASGLGLTVVEAARGQGIGSRLYDALLEHVVSLGATHVLTYLVQNDVGESFARARGFHLAKTAPILRVDPRTVTSNIPDDPDFRVVSLAEVRDRPRDVFELDSVGVLDEPSVNPMDAIRYDEYEREEWQHPDLEFDGSTVVLSGERMVAFTWLRVDAERGRGVSAFTVTHPEFRGRGLATRAKLRTLRWSAEHGITSMWTANDDSNAAMLAVNRRLGFKPIGTHLTYRRDLKGPSHS
jgi:GNAT superfamily N-acetyltransferase